ncbi:MULTISPECIES: hypothetical protein [unclassified Vibrio]|nr:MULTISPECIES: hypothetical protein [unclassified Vibrio]
MKILTTVLMILFIAGCAHSGDDMTQKERQALVKHTHSDMQGRRY